MPFILSKMTTPVSYALFAEGANGHKSVQETLTIEGGAGVANLKTLETPSGVVTEISKNQLEMLEKHPVFQAHLKNGFVAVIEAAAVADSKKQGLDMASDKSAPLTPEDFATAEKPKPVTARGKKAQK